MSKRKVSSDSTGATAASTAVVWEGKSHTEVNNISVAKDSLEMTLGHKRCRVALNGSVVTRTTLMSPHDVIISLENGQKTLWIYGVEKDFVDRLQQAAEGTKKIEKTKTTRTAAHPLSALVSLDDAEMGLRTWLPKPNPQLNRNSNNLAPTTERPRLNVENGKLCGSVERIPRIEKHPVNKELESTKGDLLGKFTVKHLRFEEQIIGCAAGSAVMVWGRSNAPKRIIFVQKVHPFQTEIPCDEISNLDFSEARVVRFKLGSPSFQTLFSQEEWEDDKTKDAEFWSFKQRGSKVSIRLDMQKDDCDKFRELIVS